MITLHYPKLYLELLVFQAKNSIDSTSVDQNIYHVDVL